LLDVRAQRRVHRQVLAHQRRVSEHAEQEVVEVVREPAGEQPEALELLRLTKLALQRLPLGLLQLGPRLLGGSPRDDAERSREHHEGAVDTCPEQARSGMRVDLAEAERRREPVMDDDEGDCQQEDEPVLVEREADHEDEEEEVRLGQPVREMHAEARGREQAERDRDRLRAARHRLPAPEQRESDHRREMEDGVQPVVPPEGPEDEQRRHVRPEEKTQAVMSTPP
jgi:hypothetical protein